MLAVLLVAGHGVGGVVGVRALTGDDEPSAGTSGSTDPTDESTDESTDDPSAGESSSAGESADPTEGAGAAPPILGACRGANPEQGATRPGRLLRGGGIRITTPPGYERSNAARVFGFADGVAAVQQQVEEFWISLYALGTLPDAGYAGPQQAAETVVECMARSELFYAGFESRTDLVSEPVTVLGAEGWVLTTEIRVSDPRVQVEGDRAAIVVVRREDDSYGLLVSVVPIGDDELAAQQSAVLAEAVGGVLG